MEIDEDGRDGEQRVIEARGVARGWVDLAGRGHCGWYVATRRGVWTVGREIEVWAVARASFSEWGGQECGDVDLTEVVRRRLGRGV